MAKRKGELIGIALKNDNLYCYCDSWKNDNYKKSKQYNKQNFVIIQRR